MPWVHQVELMLLLIRLTTVTLKFYMDHVLHAPVTLPIQPQHDMEEKILEEPCMLVGGINISTVTSRQIDGLDPALILDVGL